MTAKQFKKARFNQIQKAAEKFNICASYKQANTGTYYFELSGEDETITVRVADHADAHCSADYNCDPFDSDMIQSVKDWMKAEYNAKQAELMNADIEYDRVPVIASNYKNYSESYQLRAVVETLQSWAPFATVDLDKVKSLMP